MLNHKELKKRLDEYRKLKMTLTNYMLKSFGTSAAEEDVEILTKLQAEIDNKKKFIEKFMDSIDDTYIKQLIFFRYVRGYTWDKIAVLEGGYAHADCYRNAVNRYLAKCFPCRCGETA